MQIVNEILHLAISLTPDQISDLSKAIDDVLRQLTDTESILRDTRQDTELANGLSAQAHQVRYMIYMK